ncbi:MAG TPA: hypothetical protein VIK29_09600 [Paludibacter sp.]
MKKSINLFLFLTILFLPLNLYSAEWQWSAQVKSVVSSEINDHPRAFLWIPANCKQVRGVVVGQHNMLEEGILENATFRKTLTELGFAEVWVTPVINLVFDFNNGAGDQFNDMMQALATESGYKELEFAPVVPIGHSAAASYPWNFAAWNPERTLAVLSIHGDAPLAKHTGSGRPNPDWGKRTIEGVPGLMIEGEYEWWEERIQPALDYKTNHPQAPISFLADAGCGHFDISDEMIDYISLFLKKAAKFRLPAQMPLDNPAKLIPVDPSKGWLSPRFHPDTKPEAPAAPYAKYKGNAKDAFWYFDKEIAVAAEKYYASSRFKKTQYVACVQDGNMLDRNGEMAGANVQFKPLADGVSFKLSAVLLDSLPKDKQAIKLSGNANVKVKISRICGPVVKTADDTFAVSFYRMGFNNNRRSNDIWLMAHSLGDKNYKGASLQCGFRIPLPYKEGLDQQINFPTIPNQKEGISSLKLNATSTSGMPVYYYVQEGPAEISGNTLRFTGIPPRSKFPLKVTVVAWQYGRSIEPKVKSAEPISQFFYIEK